MVKKQWKTKKKKTIEAGMHTGTIVKVERRLKPFDYTDFHIKLDNSEQIIKWDTPSDITFTEDGEPSTKLAKFLRDLKIDVQIGEDIDLEEMLVGRRVQFTTINETHAKGIFAKIIDGTVALLQEQK